VRFGEDASLNLVENHLLGRFLFDDLEQGRVLKDVLVLLEL
jgi:hypothetical protein